MKITGQLRMCGISLKTGKRIISLLDLFSDASLLPRINYILQRDPEVPNDAKGQDVWALVLNPDDEESDG